MKKHLTLTHHVYVFPFWGALFNTNKGVRYKSTCMCGWHSTKEKSLAVAKARAIIHEKTGW